MGLQLPPGAVMMKIEHQHIQGADIQGCFGVPIQQPNGLKILTVGGISNLESLAADIYSRMTIDESDPKALRAIAKHSIEAAVIFKQVLMDRAKEEAESNAETKSED